MMDMKKIVAIAFFLLAFLSVEAQKTKTVTASGEAYGTFWFDGMPSERHEGAVMYPDQGGRYVDAPFKSGESYLFPKLPETHNNGRPTKITMRKQVDGKTETDIIWVVALKKQIPYDVPCTYEDFLKWLHRIPADQRVVRYQPVTIIK